MHYWQPADSHELEFAISGGFYAFWQLVVWAVYDAGGRVTMLELASAWWKGSDCAMKDHFARQLLRKAVTVADITGEVNLVDFCQQFLLLMTTEKAPVRN